MRVQSRLDDFFFLAVCFPQRETFISISHTVRKTSLNYFTIQIKFAFGQSLSGDVADVDVVSLTLTYLLASFGVNWSKRPSRSVGFRKFFVYRVNVF